MHKILLEAKAKNISDLEMELESIKADVNDFGPDGFYAVSYDRFKRQYPEFARDVIETFLKELDILIGDETEEELDKFWRSGELIQPADWPCLIEGAEKMIKKGKAKADGTGKNDKVLWIQLWKKYYQNDEGDEEDGDKEDEDI